MPRVLYLAGAAALLAALGQSVAPAAAQGLLDLPTGHEFAVGQNLAKESCNTRLAEQRKEPNPFQRFNIHCAGWEQPVGFVTLFPDGSRPLQWWLSESQWRRDRLNALDCPAETKPLTLSDGTAGLVQFCKLREGGWPTQLFVAQRSGRTYAGQAVPPVFPLLDESVLVLEGKRPAQEDRAERVNAALRFLEAEIGPGGVGWGTQELRSYETFMRLGRAAGDVAEHFRAETNFRSALTIQEKVFGVDSPSSLVALMRVADAVSQLGRLQEATALFARATAAYGKGGARGTWEYADFLGNRGYHEIRAGHRDAGVASLEQSVREARASGRQGPGQTAIVLGRAADGYMQINRYEDALTTAQDAVRSAEEAWGTSHPQTRWRLRTLGNAQMALGKDQDALQSYQRVTAISERYFGDSLITAGDLISLGGTERRIEGSLVHYRKAAAIARKQLGSPQIHRFDAGTVLGALFVTANAMQATGAVAAEAFEVSQLARSSVATRAITLMTARVAVSDPKAGALTRELQDATNERQEARRLAADEAALAPDKRNAERAGKLDKSLKDATAKVERLERQLIAANPRYGGLVLPQVQGAQEAQRLLGPDEAMLHVAETQRGVFLVLARRDGVVFQVASRSQRDIANLVAQLRRSIDGGDDQIKPFDLPASYALYRAVVAPLADRLQGVKHLHVVANGALASLPLGLLVTAPPTDGDYAGAAWLAKQFSISVLPSVRSLAELRQAKAAPAAAQPYLGIGNPALGQAGTRAGLDRLNDACLTDKPVDRALLAALPALPETEKELRAIGATLKAGEGGVLAGRNATKARLRQQDLSKYRVLSFATHGVLPAELRCNNEPGLILTAAGEDDGFLRASEIATLKLNADFVVLSACNTAGPGGKLGGEALSGLAQAFIYAGARSVLASHWSVASEPTVRLTTGLFEAWTKNPQAGRAAALKSVQEAMIKNPATAHPVFWAPFVLVGDRG